ncbi:hypothetical protein ACFQ9X_39670 [Catenulispora yoronensis]
MFRSSESIPPGADWAATIWHHHRGSAVVIAVIGPRWLTVADERGPRLHQPDDWVRAEIAEALRAGKLVIPLLVSGATRPGTADLPADLAELVKLQTVAMDHRGTATDRAIEALVERIAPVMGAPVMPPRVGWPVLGPPVTCPPVARPLLPAGTHRSLLSPSPSPSPSLSPSPSPSPTPDPPLRNIPPIGPHHLDRPAGVAVLDEAVHAVRGSGRAGPVVVWGGIGTGKTRLAIEYAVRREAEHSVAWWIAADRPDAVPSQLATLAQALGLALGEVPDVTAVVPALARALRHRGRWLLVFDGVGDPGELTPYLALADGGDLLVTSRTGAWGELAAAACHVGRFPRADSVRLLGARLGPAPAAVLDRLAAALDDLPARSARPPRSWPRRRWARPATPNCWPSAPPSCSRAARRTATRRRWPPRGRWPWTGWPPRPRRPGTWSAAWRCWPPRRCRSRSSRPGPRPRRRAWPKPARTRSGCWTWAPPSPAAACSRSRPARSTRSRCSRRSSAARPTAPDSPPPRPPPAAGWPRCPGPTRAIRPRCGPTGCCCRTCSRWASQPSRTAPRPPTTRAGAHCCWT